VTARLAAAAGSRRWRVHHQSRRPLGQAGWSLRRRGSRRRLERWSGQAVPSARPAALATPRHAPAAPRGRRKPSQVTISVVPVPSGTARAYVPSRRGPVPGADNDRGCRPPACGRAVPGALGWQPPSGSPEGPQLILEPPRPCGWRAPAFGWVRPGAPGWQPPYGSPEGPQFIREPPSHCRSRSQDCQMVAVVRNPAGEAPAGDRVAADDRGGARVAASSRTSTTRRARCIEPPLPGAASAAVSTAAGAPPRTQGAGQAAEDADALCSHEHRLAASRPYLPPDRPMVCPRS
jgi:hypothetical protein